MLNIILFQPEIAENVGNIIRTCIAFNACLHMIKPYGFPFNINSSKIKRSSVNYSNCNIKEYDSLKSFYYDNKLAEKDIYYLSRYGKKKPDSIKYKKDMYFMFGKESTGIDKKLLKRNMNNTYRIPISKNVRALNLANCVAIISYQYASSNKFVGLSKIDPIKSIH